MQYTRKRTFGQKLTDAFSSVTSNRSISILSLLLIIVVIPVTILLVNNQTQDQGRAAGTQSFVTRVGSTLYLNGQPLRFAGTNIAWFGLAGEYSWPSHTRIDNVLSNANSMHASVIRSFAVISVGSPDSVEPSLNTYNDGIFENIDYSIKVAQQYGMHYIMPLVDNWNYYDGGKSTYTSWRGDSNPDDFYTNQTVIQDFKNHIAHVLNHVNQYTGIAYKDDPTIMAWETTNEGWTAPDNWTEMIAGYIKSIAPNQLVTDGHMAANSDLTASQLQLPSVDLYTSHFYSNNWNPTGTFANYTSRVQSNASLAKQYNKGYYVEEFDWTSTSGTQADLTNFLSGIVNTTGLSGDLYWSLFDNGYQGDQYTLYDPGTTTDMQQRVQIISNHAVNMQPLPTLTPTPTIAGITTIDDSIQGTGQNQLNYTGTGWNHCTNCNETNPVVTYYNASQSWDNITNGYVTLAFTGTQVQFYGVTANHHGIGAVSIDGGAETHVDFYSVNKTGNVLLWTSPVLPYGSHTFKLRETGTKNASSTDYYVVVDRIDINTTTNVTSAPTPLSTNTPAPTAAPTFTSTPTLVDTIPPTAAITNPLNGSTVKRGGVVPIQATASDDVSVTQISFSINDSLLCTATTSPYVCSWSVPGKPNASYTITAKASDPMGNTATNTVNVTAK